MTTDRDEALDQIRANIEKTGWHIYLVSGGESPRYAYTIGLSEIFGSELILAGAAMIASRDVGKLVNSIARECRDNPDAGTGTITVQGIGKFQLHPTDASWRKNMIFGAFDFLDKEDVPALQILPEEDLRTIDVPKMSEPWSPDANPVWRWLDGGWPYDGIAASTHVTTNLDAMKGFAVSELMRWDAEEWEMYSGDHEDVPEDEVMKVPLATLLAFDASLEPALTVPHGTGLFRDFDDDDHPKWEPINSAAS